MKRVYALLLAISMLLSLTLPAYAEEVVEEIVEEAVEEVLEEVTDEPEEIIEEAAEEVMEEITEEVAEELVEEVAEEVPEETAEEAVEEVVSFSSSAEVASTEVASDTPMLWMHIPAQNLSFLSGIEAYCGQSFVAQLVLGEASVTSVEELEILTIQDGTAVASSTVLSIAATENQGEFSILVNSTGDHQIQHKETGKTLTIKGLEADDGVLYATNSDGTGYFSSLNYKGIWQEFNQKLGYKLYLKTSSGSSAVDPADLFTTADSVSITYTEDAADLIATVEVTAWIDAFIGYYHEDGRIFYLPAGFAGNTSECDYQPEILFLEENSDALQNSLTLQSGESAIGRFYFGSAGAYIPLPGSFQFVENTGFSFGPLSNDDVETKKLDAGPAGAHITIAFGGDTFTATVDNPNAIESENPRLFNPSSDATGNQVKTYFDVTSDFDGNIRLFFGTSTTNCKCAEGVTILAGDSITLTEQSATQDYHIKAVKEGYTVVGYRETETGPYYCMIFRVTSDNSYDNYMARNYVEFTNASGKVIESGMALKDDMMETLKYYSQYGRYYYEDDETDSFVNTLALLVKEDGEYIRLDSGRLTDISFEMLGCTTSGAITVSDPFVYSEEGESSLEAQAITVTAQPRTSFHATIVVSYTLDGTMRFTHQFLLWRNPTSSDIEIQATDLDTAGKLNAVLSSWDAFENWVNSKIEGELTVGQVVRLFLPPVSYDEVIVAQALSPRNNESNQPFTLITLIGTDSGTNTPRTTMCGLIEKASLTGVHGINFKAQEGKTMTTTTVTTVNGEYVFGQSDPFTCGILTDYKNTFRPVYDETYLTTYAGIEDFENDLPSLELPADVITSYGNIFNTSIDLGTVSGCSFEGFDYGVRATKFGFTGTQKENYYGNCTYGIYIDNDGSDYTGIGDYGADAGNATFTDYDFLHFEENDTAVKIVTLPTDASPDVIRIHDSRFIANDMEFDIEQLGTYYFYRNYFGDIKVYEDNSVEHLPRAGHYHMRDKVKVILNPCRRSPDLGQEIYWFYSGEDQHTVIERGSSMPISGEAMGELEDRADISVVNGNKTEITYTFHGKEGKK